MVIIIQKFFSTLSIHECKWYIFEIDSKYMAHIYYYFRTAVVFPIFRALGLSLNDANMFAPVSIVTAIIFYAYFVLMTRFFGQTLGKMVFGLRVISLNDQSLSWGAIMFREWIGRFISGTIIILYVVVGFLPKKQGIHDLFADTTVIHERS